MQFYIKEWRNGTATLMTGNGQVLWTFPSVASAQDACRRWYHIQTDRVEYWPVQFEDANGQPHLAC